MGRIGVVIALVVVSILATPSFSMAQEQGQVGGPPTANFPRKDFGRKTSDVIVIGTGAAFAGPVEIVAYRTVQCLVIEVDQPAFGSASESCLGPPLTSRPIVVRAGGFGYGRGTNGRIVAGFENEGPVSLQASRVQVLLKHRKKRKLLNATLADPDSAILARLGQAQPFAYWATAFPGCRKGKYSFSARAFDAAGIPLGAAKSSGRCLGA